MPVTNIRSVWSSGNLIFYERTVGQSVTGDVFTLGTAAVKVGGTSQDVDFQFYGTGSLSAIIDTGLATLTLVGITATTNKPWTISDATDASSAITGALIVTGGIGVAKVLWAGGGITMGDAKDIITNGTTGTKIGTATTQKIGFWNATPVIQQAHIADPAGGATIDAESRTAINSINALCATLGITAAA